VSESPCSSRTPNGLYDGLDTRRLVVREERHENPGVLLGSGDGGAVLAPSGDEGFEPPTPLVLLCVHPAARGSGAVPEPLTQRAVAACADPEEPWLISWGVLPRDQTQPGRSLAVVLERGRVAAGRQRLIVGRDTCLEAETRAGCVANFQ
jgi:hypothetical protein